MDEFRRLLHCSHGSHATLRNLRVVCLLGHFLLLLCSGAIAAPGLEASSCCQEHGIFYAADSGPECSTAGSIGGLNMVGTATVLPDRLRLTQCALYEAGAAWIPKKQEIEDGFFTSFKFQILDLYEGGADGIALVIQNSHLFALGGSGGGIGYGTGLSGNPGIPNSLAVEFDTWCNIDWPDPSSNHVSVQTRRNWRNSPDHSYSLGWTSAIPNLSDGNVHTVKIEYIPGNMNIFIDDLTNPVLTVSINLSTTLELDSGKAWVGITSATGTSAETHDILEWWFNEGPVVICQLTDREGGPCHERCGCKVHHHQPILNPEGTQVVFSSLANRDEVVGDRNPEWNPEIFRYDLTASRLIQDTQTEQGISIPFDFVSSQVVFLSSSAELGTNSDGNAELFIFDAASNSLTQGEETEGPNPIEHEPPLFSFEDDFASSILDPLWNWQTPRAGPSYSLTTAPGKLTINVPDTDMYDSWTGFDWMPKMSLSPQNENWSIRNTVSLAEFQEATPFHTGLFVRFGLSDFFYFGYYGGTGLRVERTGIFGHTHELTTTTVELQIDKTGATYTFSYRQLGQSSWTTIDTKTEAGLEPLSVGLFIKSWAYLNISVEFDDFSFNGRICPYDWFTANDWLTLANIHADLSSDTRYLVWASNRNIACVDAPFGRNADENYEIFWKDQSTGEVRQLTDTIGGDDLSPAGAANLWPRTDAPGTRVVFASDRQLDGPYILPGYYGLFEAYTSGTIRRLTSAVFKAEREFPAFSMDDAGTRIVFASRTNLTGRNPDGNSEIFAYDSETGIATQITVTGVSATNDMVNNHRPVLSGDGLKLAFLSNGDFSGRNPDGSEELWAYNFWGDTLYRNQFVQVTHLRKPAVASQGRSSWMDWHHLDHDGSHLVFCSNADLVTQSAEDAYEIFVALFFWQPSPCCTLNTFGFESGVENWAFRSGWPTPQHYSHWQKAFAVFFLEHIGIRTPYDEETNYFALWDSFDAEAIPHSEESLYRVDWRFSTNRATPNAVPSLRFRIGLNNQKAFAYSRLYPGSWLPLAEYPQTTEYQLFFEPPIESGELFLAFSLIDWTDDFRSSMPAGEVYLEEVSVHCCRLSALSEWEPEAISADFAAWNSTGAPVYELPECTRSAEGLSLTSGVHASAVFGCWNSPFNLFTLGKSKVYRLKSNVSATPQLGGPELRLRVHTDDFRYSWYTHYLSCYTAGESALPPEEGADYHLYLTLPFYPQPCHVSFDLIDFSDSFGGTLTLHDLSLDSHRF